MCLTTAAKKVADKGKINIGWVAERIKVLKPRPLICYRCTERAHTAKNCTSDRDRSSRSYNCGGEGHRSKECTATSKCPVCSDAGKPANHRFEGRACDPAATRRTREPEVAAREGHPPATDEAAAGETEDQITADQTSQECGHEEAMETAE